MIGAPMPDVQWFTVGATFAHDPPEAIEILDTENFAATASDGVVPAASCHFAGAADALQLGGQTHHHNYFASPILRERLDAWLD
jgi:hypothetical protein